MPNPDHGLLRRVRSYAPAQEDAGEMRRDERGIVQTIGRAGNGEGDPHTPHETL